MAQGYVAFVRTTNLGRRGAPTRVQLVTAFPSAGATSVANVRTNGTIQHLLTTHG